MRVAPGGPAAFLQASPPLPNAITAPRPTPAAPLLAAGCYVITYTSNNHPQARYDGTLRVDAATERLVASGDLYQRDPPGNGRTTTSRATARVAATGIPIFPLDDYRYYLRVVQSAPSDTGFSLEFEMHQLIRDALTNPDGTTIPVTTWRNEGTFMALMAPASYPTTGGSAGEVRNSDGATVGRLSMSWASPHLRRASVTFTRVPGCEIPLDNGSGQSWKTVFDKVGWDVTYAVSDDVLEEPSGESWSGAEAHAAMLAACEKADLDTEWRFQILCVRRIDLLESSPATTPFERENGERGYMFDLSGTDSNKLPREGVMIASHWLVPSEPMWGALQGQRAEATLTYFRTAVHEIGHAMGLLHNQVDNGFMAPTNVIAAKGLQTPETPFPDNMLWSFHPEDELRLRHWPDVVVRPGGTRWGGPGAPRRSARLPRSRPTCTDWT